MRVEVAPDDVQELTADDRGRVYLGPEYANQTVEVAVVSDTDD
jgi:hypothetical protein